MKHNTVLFGIAGMTVLATVISGAGVAHAATWRPIADEQGTERLGDLWNGLTEPDGEYKINMQAPVTVADIKLAKTCNALRIVSSVTRQDWYDDPVDPTAPVRVTLTSKGKRATADASLVKIGSVTLATKKGARVRVKIVALDRSTPVQFDMGDRQVHVTVKQRCK